MQFSDVTKEIDAYLDGYNSDEHHTPLKLDEEEYKLIFRLVRRVMTTDETLVLTKLGKLPTNYNRQERIAVVSNDVVGAMCDAYNRFMEIVKANDPTVRLTNESYGYRTGIVACLEPAFDITVSDPELIMQGDKRYWRVYTNISPEWDLE